MPEPIPTAIVVQPNLLARFLSAIVGSKKIIATLATIVFVFVKPYLAKIGVEITDEELTKVTQAMIVLVLGMGVADLGKGKAQFEAAQAAKGAVAPTSSVHVDVAPALPLPLIPPPEEKS